MNRYNGGNRAAEFRVIEGDRRGFPADRIDSPERSRLYANFAGELDDDFSLEAHESRSAMRGLGWAIVISLAAWGCAALVVWRIFAAW